MSHSQIVERMPDGLRQLVKEQALPELPPDLLNWEPAQLLEAVSVVTYVPHGPLSEANADYPTYVAYRSFFLRTRSVPLFSDGLLIVIACAEPWSARTLREYRKRLQKEVHTFGCTEMDLDRVLAHLEERFASEETAKPVATPQHVIPPGRWNINENYIQEAVKMITREAYRLGASDIILDPMEDRLRVRFRINGLPEEMPPIDKALATQVTGAFKAYSNISDDNLTVPESGRCRVEVEPGRPIDLRVESQPTPWGSALVMRLLDPESIKRHLGTLPFTGHDLEIVKAVLSREDGIILVCGPTGSGKSTTLYRMLTSLDLVENNIRTIEDPIEYLVDGIAQLQAPKDPETKQPMFGSVLRSHLRADPDVLMVGEIRDSDTAGAAVQASLTGHLILSTLHTNDAPGALQRLIDLGVSPFLIKQTLSLVIAQRLVTKLCPKCKVAAPTSPKIASHYAFHGMTAPERVFERCGCPTCSGTGIVGRLPVFEFLYFSSKLKETWTGDLKLDALRGAWKAAGGETLAERGLRLVAEGLTTHDAVRIFEAAYIPAGGWDDQ